MNWEENDKAQLSAILLLGKMKVTPYKQAATNPCPSCESREFDSYIVRDVTADVCAGCGRPVRINAARFFGAIKAELKAHR